MNQDLINTTGAEELREAMLGSRNWQERTTPQPSPTRTNKLVSAFVVFLIVFGIVVGMVAAGRAAQSADHMRPHEITLVMPPSDDRPNIVTISGAYPDWDACQKAKQRVRVAAGKVVCSIVNPWRVR